MAGETMETKTWPTWTEAEFNKWAMQRFGQSADSVFLVTDRWLRQGNAVQIYADGDFSRLDAGDQPSEARGPVVAVYRGGDTSNG